MNLYKYPQSVYEYLTGKTYENIVNEYIVQWPTHKKIKRNGVGYSMRSISGHWKRSETYVRFIPTEFRRNWTMVSNNGDRFTVEYPRSSVTHDLEVEKVRKGLTARRRKRNSITIDIMPNFRGSLALKSMIRPTTERNRGCRLKIVKAKGTRSWNDRVWRSSWTIELLNKLVT